MQQSSPQADPERARRAIRRAVRILWVFDPRGQLHEAALPDFGRALWQLLEPAERNREGD
jgi:hypothetical protein